MYTSDGAIVSERVSGLRAALIRLTGHSSELAAQYGVANTYAVLGAGLILAPSLSAWGMFDTMYFAADFGVGASISLAVFAFAFVFVVDWWICVTPRLGDGAWERLKFVAVRLGLSLAVSATTTYGLIAMIDAPQIKAAAVDEATRNASSHVASVNKADQRQLDANKAKITSDNDRLTQIADKRRQLYNDWEATWVKPCVVGGLMDCEGNDIRTVGAGHYRTRTSYDQYAASSEDEKKALTTEISSLTSSDTTLSSRIADKAGTVTAADSANTGFGPRTAALEKFFLHQPVLWLLALVLLLWDLTIAVIKTTMRVNGFDRRERRIVAAEAASEQADERYFESPESVEALRSIVALRADEERAGAIAELDTVRAAREAAEPIRRDAAIARARADAQRDAARADRRPKRRFRRRPLAGLVGGAAVLLVLGTSAVLGLGHHHRTEGGTAQAPATAAPEPAPAKKTKTAQLSLPDPSQSIAAKTKAYLRTKDGRQMMALHSAVRSQDQRFTSERCATTEARLTGSALNGAAGVPDPSLQELVVDEAHVAALQGDCDRAENPSTMYRIVSLTDQRLSQLGVAR